MNESSNQKVLLILPALQDPPSAGVFLVRHMPASIAFIFAFLALSVISATALVQLDVTIRADVGATVRCPNKNTSYCARTYVSAEKMKQIALGNQALLVVEAESNYRKKTIAGTVHSIEKNVNVSDEELPHAVMIELVGDRPASDASSVFALIVVGSQSGFESLNASLLDFFKRS